MLLGGLRLWVRMLPIVSSAPEPIGRTELHVALPATPRAEPPRHGAGRVRPAPHRVPSGAVIDDNTVRHVARLARLRLEPDEETHMRDELSVILEHVEAIQKLDLDDVPPTTHVQPLENVLREDVPVPGLTVEEALREAPATTGGKFFSVPRFE